MFYFGPQLIIQDVSILIQKLYDRHTKIRVCLKVNLMETMFILQVGKVLLVELKVPKIWLTNCSQISVSYLS